MMQSFGVTTTIARNGREAVDLAKQQTFDLILMDMQMPIMDGLEATQRIKQSGNRTPIVALTANVLQQHREQFHAAGCDEFLAKPIDRNSLFELLSHHLQPATNREPVAEPSTPSVLIDDELRELFQERSALMKTQLSEGLAKKDWVSVRAAAHTIKGSGTTFGYPELTKLGIAVCNEIDQGEESKIISRVEALIEAIEQM